MPNKAPPHSAEDLSLLIHHQQEGQWLKTHIQAAKSDKKQPTGFPTLWYTTEPACSDAPLAAAFYRLHDTCQLTHKFYKLSHP